MHGSAPIPYQIMAGASLPRESVESRLSIIVRPSADTILTSYPLCGARSDASTTTESSIWNVVAGRPEAFLKTRERVGSACAHNAARRTSAAARRISSADVRYFIESVGQHNPALLHDSVNGDLEPRWRVHDEGGPLRWLDLHPESRTTLCRKTRTITQFGPEYNSRRIRCQRKYDDFLLRLFDFAASDKKTKPPPRSWNDAAEEGVWRKEMDGERLEG